MRAVVTGAAGFIGAYLARALAERGDEVVAVDNYLRGQPKRLAGVDNISMFPCDARDAVALSEAFAGADVVFHLAAINGTENFYNRPELVLDVGLRSALAVVEACRTAKVPDVVFASSAEVYQTPATVPTDETIAMVIPDSLNPRYSYGGSKLISELIAFNYGQDHFRKVQVFRPHNIYGPDMGWKHVIPQLIGKVTEARQAGKGSIAIQGDGSETRAFCYVDDVVSGILRMYDRGAHRQIYHIGSMEEVSIAHLAQLISTTMDADVAIEASAPMPGGTPRRCPDIGKMRQLGYEPRVDLKEGILRTANWYRDNGVAPADNPLL